MRHGISAAMAAALLLAAPASAADKPKGKKEDGRPAAEMQALAACRQVADAAARLACYDQASDKLAEAVERRDVVVLDRTEIKRTRRSLFGFSLPSIPLFRGEQGEEQTEIESKITSASSMGMGKWQIVIEDGAVWQTTDSSNIRDPKSGQKIVIKKGALGSYFIRVNGQRGVRGRRTS
jgi:hypothetical protein